MSNDLEQPADDRAIETAIPATPQKKGATVLAWIAIVLLVGLVLYMHTREGPAAIPAPGEAVDVRLMELQARYFVGAKSFFPQQGKELYDKAEETLDTGPLDQRLRFVVLAGELGGAAEARAQLRVLSAKLLQAGVKETPEQATLLDELQRLYDDYTAGRFQMPSLTKEEREQLRHDLGWFGELALAPPGTPDTAAREAVVKSARRTVFTILGYVAGIGMLGLLGFAGLTFFVIFLFSGKLGRGIHTGLPHGGVYAETFALWMALFLGLNIVVGVLSFPPEARWLVTGLASLLSLSALFWPVMRGIPWSEVRWEIGLRFGKQPALDPVIGIATYAMAIPLVFLGVLVTVTIFMMEGALQGVGGNTGDNFSPVHLPSHPVVSYVMGGDWWVRLQVLLLASVIAPIVEETMFRGILYRHLREASAGLGFIVSVLFSATLVSFVFAVIHPQGLETVPILMALAFTFCLVREWRGSLVPAMIAHGISNGLVLLGLILAIGD
jgi:membrane protease YdiL (CAAX protease family)